MTDNVLSVSTVEQLVSFIGLSFGEATELKLAASGVAPVPLASGGSASVTSAVISLPLASHAPVSVGDAYALFLTAYNATPAPEYPDQLLAAVRETTFAFSRKLSVAEAEVVRYFKDIQAEALEHKDELLDSIAESAVLIWTSAKRLTLAPGKTVEFCSLLNRILREQQPDVLASACGVVRGINLLCVTRRDETKLLYPPGGQSHRGGGLPLEHVPFFVVGKKFRVPMFLATSFDEDVAFRWLSSALASVSLRVTDELVGRFWLMALDSGLPPVHWIVRVDPRGETSLRCGCVCFVHSAGCSEC